MPANANSSIGLQTASFNRLIAADPGPSGGAKSDSGASTTKQEEGAAKPPSTESFNVKKYLSSGEEGEGKEKQEQSYLNSKNPIASFIVQIVNFLMLTIGSFSFLAVIVGGITLLTSHGNDTQVTKGKDILKYAITGLVVSLSAYFITSFVQNIFYELPKT